MNKITDLIPEKRNFRTEMKYAIIFLCFSVIIFLLLAFKQNPAQFEYLSMLDTIILFITLIIVFLILRWVPAQQFFFDKKI